MTTDPELEELLKGISLEALKGRAKDLHRATRDGRSAARQRVEPYFDDPSTLKLQQAQLVIARECGFPSWRKLRSFIRLRDATMTAKRQLANVQARMSPSKSLIVEYRRANRRVQRLTERWQKARPDTGKGPDMLELDPQPREPAGGDDRSIPLCCSFCNKSQYEVPKLIAGPGVFICNECVMLCVDILQDEAAAELSQEGPTQ